MSESSDLKALVRRPGRKPLSEGSAEDTRKTLLHHAARLFNERGYAAVSLNEIARAAGVNRATLYYHFPTKEELFVTASDRVMSLVRSEVEKVVNDASQTVLERIARLIHRRTEMSEMDLTAAPFEIEELDSDMVQAAIPELSPEGQARIGAQFGAINGLMYGLFAEGVARGELPQIDVGVLNFLFWQAFPADGYPPHLGLPRREIEAQLLRMIFQIESTPGESAQPEPG